MRSRIFRLVVVWLPDEFRASFGEELIATAEAADRARPLRWRDAPAAVVDALVTIATIRREMRAERRHEAARPRRAIMDGLAHDVRFAVRGLRREPGLTLFVIAALTLGIGANAAMFGIADRLLVSGPRLIRDSDRVMRLYLTMQPPGRAPVTISGLGNVTYDLTRRSTTLSGVATYSIDQVIVGEGAEAHTVPAGFASETLFPLLGVQPRLGRFFDTADNGPTTAAHVAVLGYHTWQGAFGGASDAIGRTLAIGGEPYTVVGVAPAGFTGPQFGPVDLWLPMNLKSQRVTKDWQTTWNAEWLRIIGRLAPGVTRAQAGDELTAIFDRGYSGPRPELARATLSVAPLSANDAGAEAPEITVVRWLSGVAAVVLLIACANVANLLLARGVRRSREIAVRAALGAGRTRLARLLLTEALLLSTAGALGGLVVAYGLGMVARREIFSWVDWTSPPVDGRVLAAAAILAGITGLLVGALPAWRISQAHLGDALKRGAREGGGDRSRARHALTIAQATLSVVLLIGAGLFVRSLWNVRTLPLGFDPARVLRAEVSRPALSQIADRAARAAERTRRAAADVAALDDIRRLPGVEHVSLAVGTPFGNRFTVKLSVPGLASLPDLPSGPPSVSAVTSDYFATVGTRILRGRAFGPEDHAGSEPVAIVSDTMARAIWPDRDAIGQCLVSGDGPSPPCARVIGVAEDTHRDALREPPVMHYYIPFGQEVGFGGTATLVRSSGDPESIGPALRRTLIDRDPSIRFVALATIQDAIDPETRPWRLGTAVFLAAGLLALVVAAIGIYSVMSYLVADRAREIGVRLALGAGTGHVAGLILRGSVGMAAVGIGVGCLAAAALSPLVEPLLFQVSARDPLTYLAVAALLLVVALGAGVVPTIRANRIDPLDALRVE